MNKGGNNNKYSGKKRERPKNNQNKRQEPKQSDDIKNKKGNQKLKKQASNAPVNRPNQNATPSTSESVLKFWRNFCSSKNKRPTLHLTDQNLWLETWKAAAFGVNGPLDQLLFTYQLLPATRISTVPVETVVQVLKRCVSTYQGKSEVDLMEAVVDIVKERLIHSLEDSNIPLSLNDTYKDFPYSYRNKIISLLAKYTRPPESSRLESLLPRTEELRTFGTLIERKAQETSALITTDDSDTKLDGSRESSVAWSSKPTVAWLMSAEWRRIDPRRYHFESPKQYAQSVLSLWTLMTFYWGAGALTPHCSTRQGGANPGDSNANACGEPLLTFANGGTCSYRVRGPGGESRVCGAKAALRCHRHNHDAICDSCLRKRRQNLIGAPGQWASTDIYDARIYRETIRREGVVYCLCDVASRRPPPIAPNWRTTYRLQPAALVAVCRLSVSGEPLMPPEHYPLEWGEVVSLGREVDDEWKNRAAGKMAIRLLNCGDCYGMPPETNTRMEVGMRCAIIDLRVFVPEVISVLSTVASPDFVKHLSDIPFVDRLIGRDTGPTFNPVIHSANNMECVTESYDVFNANEISHFEVILAALKNSEISHVHRLDPERLARGICALKPIQNLYGTQLEAFASALFSSVHCTQGPPGTGKSYIGVCLVLALNLIREELKKNNQYEAIGPILVLSYKNHALEEFLLDLIPYLPRTGNSLIRCGKSEDPRLLRFGEKGDRGAGDRKKDELALRIRSVRHAKVLCKDWLDQARVCESDLEAAIGHEEKCPIRKAFITAILFCAKLLEDEVGDPFSSAGTPTTEVSFEVAFRVLASLQEQEQEEGSQEMTHIQLTLLVQHLTNGMEHWRSDTQNQDQKTHVYFLLSCWLRGLIPPPRCRGLNCQEAAVGEGLYCQIHRCRSSVKRDCGNPRLRNTTFYCEEHACAVDNCNGESEIALRSVFCRVHTCPGCLLTETFPIRGMFACEAHQCVEGRCNKLRVFPHEFCEDHLCVECGGRGVVLNLPILPFTNARLCVQHCCRWERCPGLRAEGYEFCGYHLCVACPGHLKAPVDPVCPQSRLCRGHRCEAVFRTPCAQSKVEKSPYCLSHTCRICLEGDVPSCGPALRAPPRNVCGDHPLCVQILQSGAMCCTLADKPDPLCVTHKLRLLEEKDLKPLEKNKEKVLIKRKFQGDGFCCGIVKKQNRRCKAKGERLDGGKWFCTAHEDQREINEEEEDEESELEKEVEEGQGVPKEKEITAEEKEGDLVSGGEGESSDESSWVDSDFNSFNSEQYDDLEEEEEEKEEVDGFVTPEDTLETDNNENIIEVNDMKVDEPYPFEPVPMDFAIPSTLSPAFEADDQYLAQKSVNSFVLVECCDRHCHVKAFMERGWLQQWYCGIHSYVPEIPTTNTSTQQMEVSVPMVFEMSRTGESCMKIVEESTLLNEDNQVDKENAKEQMGEGVGWTEKSAAEVLDEDLDQILLDDIPLPADPLQGILNPDEMDYEEEEEEEEENEELRRLRSITEIDHDSDEDSVASVSHPEENEKLPNPTDTTVDLMTDLHMDTVSFIDVIKGWHWEMTKAERLQSCARLFRRLVKVVEFLCQQSEVGIARVRVDCAEEGAAMFRSAGVVGATVVGAVRRINALRAAQPFAVVVEEACEVLEEPLLAVLATASLRKLELIGDHRQLPAFVQQCWYSLEMSIPSMKVSLFERLISGKVNARIARGMRHDRTAEAEVKTLPCTILDEQRRMRKTISDITRPDYVDLVSIIDHEGTATQRVGDKALANITGNLRGKQFKREDEDLQKNQLVIGKALKLHRKSWVGLGREIPGISSHVFFWDIPDNKEGRPVAGLSACNYMEADAAAGLSKYLMSCGVPAQSISIITPYKGQKMAILKKLRALKLVPGFRKGSVTDGITVSTVDRYQGDENDVIILSLVRTRPGNRFLALHNRFIVATSRARLGFFIVGSVNAVKLSAKGGEGPKHWMRFLKTLEFPQNNDENDGDYDLTEDLKMPTEDLLYTGTRLGPKLPICCPRHVPPAGVPVKLVESPEEFPTLDSWNEFCCQPCDHELETCGHKCHLPCHSPVLKHQQQCVFPVERPCLDHLDVPLLCHEATNAYQEQLKEVGDRIPVTERKISLARALECFKCSIEVQYRRRECEHACRLPCYQEKQVSARLRQLDDCKEIVQDFIHPRCNHVFPKPTCAKRRQFELNPPKCQTQVVHERPCGCSVRMTCHEQLLERESPPVCKFGINWHRPRCSHILSLRCHVATGVQAQWDAGDNDPAELKEDRCIVRCKEAYGPEETFFDRSIPRCEVKTTLQLSCGHYVHDIPCHRAFLIAARKEPEPTCKEPVQLPSPLCSHPVRLPCFVSTLVEPWEEVKRILETRVVRSNDPTPRFSEEGLKTVQLPALKKDVIKTLSLSCNKRCIVTRSCGLGHELELTCRDLQKVLWRTSTLPACIRETEIAIPCGHSAKVLCVKRFDQAPPCRFPMSIPFIFACGQHRLKNLTCEKLHRLNNDQPPCRTQVSVTRFRCGHQVAVPCYQADLAQEYTVGKNYQNTGSMENDLLVVLQGEFYCDTRVELPLCKESVDFEYLCGHRRTGVSCCDAFAWAVEESPAPPCETLVEVEHPLCQHSVDIQCSLLAGFQEWRGDLKGGKPLEKDEVLEFTDEDGIDHVITHVTEVCLPEPVDVPKELKQALFCKEPLMLERSCGHSIRLPCSRVLSKRDLKECEEVVQQICEKCGCTRDISCALHIRVKGRGELLDPCSNEVEKVCSTCGVNKVKVPCYTEVVECKRMVVCDLPCGHEDSWICGKKNPMEKKTCRSCVKMEWDLMFSRLEELEKQKEMSSIAFDLEGQGIVHQKLLGMELLQVVDYEQIDIQEVFSVHLQSRTRILKNFYQLLINKKVDPIAPPPDELTQEQLQVNYDVVFTPYKSKQPSNQVKLFSELHDTQFGAGIKAFLLNEKAFEQLELKSENGETMVAVGLAFRLKSLDNPKQFRSNKNAKNKRKENEMRAKANKTSLNKQNEGFDHVSAPLVKNLLELNEDQEPDSSDFLRKIYWTVGSVIPLGLLTLRIHVNCSLCFDAFPVSKGVGCNKKHFLCFECLENYVEQAGKEDSVGKNLNEEGILTCPGCRDCYDYQMLAKETTKEIFHKIDELKVSVSSRKAAEEGRREMKEQKDKEFQRIMAILDLDEKKAEMVRMDIRENVLNLKCPRCKAVFLDFEGCFALTCRCGAGFCAWCLQDCGGDAHAHVAHCRENRTGDVFGSFDVFTNHHNMRKKRLIQEILSNEPNVVQKRVKELLVRDDLKDTGIKLN